MDSSPQVLVYIKPPKYLSGILREINENIADKYSNDYRSNVDGEWESHLMLWLSKVPSRNIDQLLELISKILNKFHPVKILLGKFTVNGKYIFWDVNERSSKTLKSIHIELVNKLKHLRDNKIAQKYLDIWDKLKDDEKIKIAKIGMPYEYHPHFTVARLLEEVPQLDSKFIKNYQSNIKSFIGGEIKVVVENNQKNSDWTTIKEYKLK